MSVGMHPGVCILRQPSSAGLNAQTLSLAGFLIRGSTTCVPVILARITNSILFSRSVYYHLTAQYSCMGDWV